MAVDLDAHQKLNQLKEEFGRFDASDFKRARSITNPFEELPDNIFIDRAGFKLANIDAVFNVTGNSGLYTAQQTEGLFTFCDLAGGPGAWSQYLHYRRTSAIGYGITLRVEGNLAWNRSALDETRFNFLYGADETGNLYTNADSFSKIVRDKEPIGVDFVMADGGIGVEGKEELQEMLNSRLILSEILVALKTLKMGGTLVCKLFETVTPLMVQLLYLISTCFTSLILFKPLSSRPANSERYLIAKGRLDTIHTRYQTNILETAYRAYNNDDVIVNLVQSVPEPFVQWMTRQNNRFTIDTYNAGLLLLSYLKGETITLPVMNLYKCLGLWNLPDTPIYQGLSCLSCDGPGDEDDRPRGGGQGRGRGRGRGRGGRGRGGRGGPR
jgi:cap1 methyltransferase